MTGHSKQEIAESFSNGNFALAYPYLSESIVWNVIGESQFVGKSNVIENCNRTAAYFESIETYFKTEDVIKAGNSIVIRGTGEFLKEGKRLNLVSACDVYEFDENNKLERISSYCIPEKRANETSTK